MSSSNVEVFVNVFTKNSSEEEVKNLTLELKSLDGNCFGYAGKVTYPDGKVTEAAFGWSPTPPDEKVQEFLQEVRSLFSGTVLVNGENL